MEQYNLDEEGSKISTHWNLAVSGSLSSSSLTGDLGMCLLNLTGNRKFIRINITINYAPAAECHQISFL